MVHLKLSLLALMLLSNFMSPTWGHEELYKRYQIYVNKNENITIGNDQEINLLKHEERLLGLAMVYSEAKYNFLFWDQVPELDWDAAFLEFVPLAENVKDDFGYYLILQRFIALLRDGHTFIVYPSRIWQLFDAPPIRIRLIEDKHIITACPSSDVIGSDLIQPFSEILSVDGKPAEQYLNENVIPYISSGTEHYRRYMGCMQLLVGKRNTKVKLKIKNPTNEIRNVVLTRNVTGIPAEKRPIMLIELPRLKWELPSIEHRFLGDGLHYIAINTMADSKLPEKFDRILDSLKSPRGLILDLRNNHGGNSRYAEEVACRLFDKKIPRDYRRTPAYRPSERAWNKEKFGDNWHEYKQEWLTPRGRFQFIGPVVVMTSPYTWSAAENFLVPLVASQRITVVGQPTGGSTGQPLFLPLIGSGRIGICSVRSFYPDGKEFVGYGIQPDVFIEPKLEALRAGRDNVLEEAIKVLQASCSLTYRKRSIR